MLEQFSTHSLPHFLFYCCTLSSSTYKSDIALYTRENCTPSISICLHNFFSHVGFVFASAHYHNNGENLCHCFLINGLRGLVKICYHVNVEIFAGLNFRIFRIFKSTAKVFP